MVKVSDVARLKSDIPTFSSEEKYNGKRHEKVVSPGTGEGTEVRGKY
jgi:hypothetical protein